MSLAVFTPLLLSKVKSLLIVNFPLQFSATQFVVWLITELVLCNMLFIILYIISFINSYSHNLKGQLHR